MVAEEEEFGHALLLQRQKLCGMELDTWDENNEQEDFVVPFVLKALLHIPMYTILETFPA